MKIYRPSYYKNFRCIGSACSDNCCIGWEIDIDDDSAERYLSVPGDFGQRLKNSIACDEEGHHFILSGERCPFLNQDNLCDIFIHMGENALCDICTQHPRFHEWFGDWKESGLGLCCEAAGKLIFEAPSPASFEIAVSDEEPSDFEDSEWLNCLFHARETAFQIIQDRSRSFIERLLLLVIYGEELQQDLNACSTQLVMKDAQAYADPQMALQITLPDCQCSREELFAQLLDTFLPLEPIDPAWPEKLCFIREHMADVLKSWDQLVKERPQCWEEYEKFAVYIIFRYFLKSVFDDEVSSKTGLAAVSCLMMFLLDGERYLQKKAFSLEDRIFLAKQYSKEIEYCTENLEALADHYWNTETGAAFLTAILQSFSL